MVRLAYGKEVNVIEYRMGRELNGGVFGYCLGHFWEFHFGISLLLCVFPKFPEKSQFSLIFTEFY